jgi:hypothetical protein
MPPQTDQFIPLTATMPSADKREFPINIIPQGQQTQAFQSIENSTAAGRTGKKNCEPSVSVQRDNGRVSRIQIQCSCGQTIDLECLYQEATKVDEPPKPETPKTEPPKVAPPKAEAAPKRRK